MKRLLPVLAVSIAFTPLSASASIIEGQLAGYVSWSAGSLATTDRPQFTATFTYDTDAFDVDFSYEYGSRWLLDENAKTSMLPKLTFNLDGHDTVTLIGNIGRAVAWTDVPSTTNEGYYRNGMNLSFSNGATSFVLNFENQGWGWNYLTDPHDLASWVLNKNLAGSIDTYASVSDILASPGGTEHLWLTSAVITEKCPEPTTTLLLGCGVTGLLAARRRTLPRNGRQNEGFFH